MVLTCAYGHRIQNALNGRIWFLLHFMFLMLFFANLLIFNFPNSAGYWTGVMQLYGKDTNMWPHLRAVVVEYNNSLWQFLSWHDMARICGIRSYPVVLKLSHSARTYSYLKNRSGSQGNMYTHNSFPSRWHLRLARYKFIFQDKPK